MQELSQGVFRVFQEQAVVTQWRHRNGHLGQVVQILKHGALEVGNKNKGAFISTNVHGMCFMYHKMGQVGLC